MKKLLTMLSLICVLAVTATVFSVLAAAEGPALTKGDIFDAEAIANEFLAQQTDDERLQKAKELNTYLFAYPINQRYSRTVFELVYGDSAEYRYSIYNLLVERIMAYGALKMAEAYNPDAHTYECKRDAQWLERFLEYDISDYTKEQVLSESFFNIFLDKSATVTLTKDNGKAVYRIEFANRTESEIAISFTSALDEIRAIESVVFGETDGTVWTENTDYTFTAGVFAVKADEKVPAAEYVEQEPGKTVMVAGTAVITVTGSLKDQVNQGDQNQKPDPDKNRSVGEIAKEKIEHAEEKLKTVREMLSKQALSEYENPNIIYRLDLTSSSTATQNLSNKDQLNWSGIMYDNGYNVGDVMPKFDYISSGGAFLSVEPGSGNYDALKAGTYVIFDEGVTDYYKSEKSGVTLMEGAVKRNYIYDVADGGYVKVEDGKGVYDLVSDNGYGKLLAPSKYLYLDATGNPNAAAYTQWGTEKKIKNVVMQTDIGYFGEHGSSVFELRVRLMDGDHKGPRLFKIEDGDITFLQTGKDASGTDRTKETYTLYDVLVPGRWTNLAIVMQGVNVTIYVDYEPVYSIVYDTVVLGKTPSGYSEWDVTGYYYLRAYTDVEDISKKNDALKTIGHGLKNTVVYEGTVPRDLEMFDKMTDEERFIYYEDCIVDEKNGSATKMYAYEWMKENVNKFYNPTEGNEYGYIDENGKLAGGTFIEGASKELISAVTDFYKFDYDTLLGEYKRENTDKYVELVNKFKDIKRLYDQIGSRETAKNNVDSYVLQNSDAQGVIVFLDTDGDKFKEAYEKYTQLCIELENDKKSFEFVSAMEYYDTFKLYKKKADQYEVAKQLLRDNVYDQSIPDERLANALALYGKVPEQLDAMISVENSEYLVMYIEYTKQFDSITLWEQNYSKIDYAISKARAILSSGKYDKNYVEVDDDGNETSLAELISWYELINGYFYEKLQQEHIAYITELQQRYIETDSYMEKFGICNAIKSYIESADMDLEDTRIKILIEKTEEYLSEIDALEGPYLAQRDKETELFISVVKMLDAAEGYNEISELIAEATNHYYSMTVGATDAVTEEEFSAALEKYNYYIEYRNETADASEDFKLIVSKLSSDKKYSEIYRILKDASALVDYISKDIEGVSEAYNKYSAAYDDYVAVTSPVRAEIAETQSSVVSLRSGYGVAAIMSFFAGLVQSVAD